MTKPRSRVYLSAQLLARDSSDTTRRACLLSQDDWRRLQLVGWSLLSLPMIAPAGIVPRTLMLRMDWHHVPDHAVLSDNMHWAVVDAAAIVVGASRLALQLEATIGRRSWDPCWTLRARGVDGQRWRSASIYQSQLAQLLQAAAGWDPVWPADYCPTPVS